MKRAASKSAKPRAPAKKRVKPVAGPVAASPTDQTQDQQHLLQLQNEQLCAAHAELEQSQQRFADLYDQAPVGYLTLDGRGCIREINQTACQMLGWSAAHLLDWPLLPYIAASDRKAWMKHLGESRRRTGNVITTLRLQSRDGALRMVQFATCRQDAVGPQAKWCRTVMLDTTEKSAAEAALSASEAKFRLMAEHMGEVFWFMELDPPRVTYVSPAFEQIWGLPAAELYADYEIWMKTIHPDDFAAVHAEFLHWLAGETSGFHVEYRLLNRQGRVRWIADRGIVISRRDGRPHEISGIARDVTERKHDQEKFRGLLEAAPDAMIIVDHDGIVQLVNAQAIRLFGHSREELVGHVIEMLVPGPLRARHLQHREDFLAAPRSTTLRRGLELHGLRKDGSEFPIEITLSPLHTEEGVLVISAVRDISERKHAEDELQLRYAELRAKNNELERFNRAMVDRELRMIELKQEINALLHQAGQPPRYRMEFATQ